MASPAASFVGGVGIFRQQSLVAQGHGLLQEGRRLTPASRAAAGDEVRPGNCLSQCREALRGGIVDEQVAVEVDAVEKECPQGQLAAQSFGAVATPEAAHGGLERLRPSVAAQYQNVAVEDQFRGGRTRDRFHHLRGGGAHVLALPTENPHLFALLVDLHACPVELELQVGVREQGERILEPLCGLSEHGRDRGEQAQRDLRQVGRPLLEGDRPSLCARFRQRHPAKSPAGRRAGRLKTPLSVLRPFTAPDSGCQRRDYGMQVLPPVVGGHPRGQGQGRRGGRGRISRRHHSADGTRSR